MAKAVTITLNLRAAKVTKNCVVYSELDDDGDVRDKTDAEATIKGAIYLSKDQIKAAGFKKAPKELTITIEAA